MNKNYIINPIIENKYYISESDYFDIEKKSDYGYILNDKNNNVFYANEQSSQGLIFKDFENYKSGKGVCYIPEYAFEENNKIKSYRDYGKGIDDGVYCKEDIFNAVRSELLNDEYSYNFKSNDLPIGLVEKISDFVFDIVDWQYPESFLGEISLDDDIKEYFKDNPEDLYKYGSDEFIENNKLKTFNILVNEYYHGTYEIEAESYEDACNILENKINNGEIILDNTDTYERTLSDATEYEKEGDDYGFN